MLCFVHAFEIITLRKPQTTRSSSVIRGHHIYKEVWEPIHGQILQCTRKTNNRFDPFAVSIVSDGEIVGYVPQKISAARALFLQHQVQFSVKLQEVGGI